MNKTTCVGVVAVCLGAWLGLTAAAHADNPPGLPFAALLNGVKLRPGTSDLRFDNLRAVFLPPAQSKGGGNPYNPDDGGKLWAILTDGAGQELARFDFWAEALEQPYWLLSAYRTTDLKTGEKGDSADQKLAPGDYVLSFFLDSGKFYTFPFKVTKAESADPFAGGTVHFLEGAWTDWAYLFYSGANPEQALVWKVWLRHKGVGEKSVKVKCEVKRDGDGQLVCVSRPDMTYTLNPGWVRYEFDLIFPMQGTGGGAYFKAKDLLAKDGSYTMKMAVDSQDYGTWKFQVAGGKLNYTGRTVRGQADPLTFVEGGRDAWWYCKQ
jgi:hypothetical protein